MPKFDERTRPASGAGIELVSGEADFGGSFSYLRGDTSGIGNQILSALSALQLQATISRTVRFLDSPVRPTTGHPERPDRRLRRTRWISSSRLLSSGPEGGAVIDEMQRHIDRGRRVVVRGPMLGAHLVRFQEARAIEAARVNVRRCSTETRGPVEPFGVLHFRYGDFVAWNPKAVLPSRYYLDAIDVAQARHGIRQFHLAYDDATHPALAAVKDHLSKRDLLASPTRCTGHTACDFSLLHSASLVVSSPSTFAIAACILGGATIIQARAWVDLAADRGDPFWSAVRADSFRHYRVSDFV